MMLSETLALPKRLDRFICITQIYRILKGKKITFVPNFKLRGSSIKQKSSRWFPAAFPIIPSLGLYLMGNYSKSTKSKKQYSRYILICSNQNLDFDSLFFQYINSTSGLGQHPFKNY